VQNGASNKVTCDTPKHCFVFRCATTGVSHSVVHSPPKAAGTAAPAAPRSYACAKGTRWNRHRTTGSTGVENGSATEVGASVAEQECDRGSELCRGCGYRDVDLLERAKALGRRSGSPIGHDVRCACHVRRASRRPPAAVRTAWPSLQRRNRNTRTTDLSASKLLMLDIGSSLTPGESAS
jgi:hypothetical protein